MLCERAIAAILIVWYSLIVSEAVETLQLQPIGLKSLVRFWVAVSSSCRTKAMTEFDTSLWA